MEIVVIGGIAAGMSVAAKAARTNENANITVIEKESYVSFGACGLPYYLGDQFDNQDIMYARTPKQMKKAGVDVLIEHEAVSVDFENKTVNVKDLEKNETKTLSYDRLMIATGAKAIMPPIDGLESDNVYTITRPYTVEKLKTNLDKYEDIVIIGGGFIGVEVAEQLAKLNKNVHIIEGLKGIMSGPFDKEFQDKIEMALTDVGVEITTGRFAEELVVENNKVTGVKTKDKTFKADALIVATGFRPNTEFIKDQLEMLDNGAIVIDKYGQTSMDDVFSAGDCASVPHQFLNDQYIPLATYANKLGRLIGTNIVSEKNEWLSFDGALGSSAIKAGNYEGFVTGLKESQAEDLGYNIKTTLIETSNHAGYYPNQEKIMIKLVYDAESFVLYGAQMFGKRDVVLRGTGLTTAIHAGLTTKEIGFIDYAYSPPFASTWETLNVAANTAK